MSKFVIKTSEDGESFNVFLNNVAIGGADHDKNGWAGMEDVENLIQSISSVLGIPVEYTQEDER